MFFVGYLSDKRIDYIEEKLNSHIIKNSNEISYEHENMFAWVRYEIKSNQFSDLIQINEDNMYIIDGFQIIKKKTEFELLDERKIANLINFINRSESNITTCSLKISDDGIILYLTSNLAGPGRIWYTIPTKSTIIFSNDIRLLLKIVDFQPNYSALLSILKYGKIPEPDSISKNIYSIPPATAMYNSPPKIRLKAESFYNYNFTASKSDLINIREILSAIGDFLPKLKPSLLLSGGVDSSLLAHLIPYREMKAFFLQFGDNDSEYPYAEKVAIDANLTFKPYTMNDIDAYETIFEVASAYIQPFSDGSVIPTYYLLNQIQKEYPECNNIIDGTGADACFGFMSSNTALIWKSIDLFPCILRKAVRWIYSKSTVFSTKSSFEYTLRQVSKAADCDIILATITSYPGTQLYTQKHIDLNIRNQINFNNLINRNNDNCFNSRATIADINSYVQKGCMKTHKVGTNPINVLYPYLWLSILVEQGKLKWNIKDYKGIIKYPLKKILEDYKPKEFIYRKKSGFVPPLERWILKDEISNKLVEIIHSLSKPWSNIVSKRQILYSFNKSKRRSSFSIPFINFLWGLIFTELWMRKNIYQDI